MQGYITIKKIFTYLLTAIVTTTFMTCTSRITLYTGGPFSRELLEKNNLIFEKSYNNLHIRIVYPPNVSDPKQRQLIEKYIQAFPEKRVFDDMNVDMGVIEESSLNPDEEYHLAIYGYIIAYRTQTVSLSFQVQYWTNNSKKTERWYTLNYNKDTQAIISLNSLFEDFAGASSELERYILDNMIQQDTLRNIGTRQSTVPLKDTIHNFVFIPSTQNKNQFTGLKVYINTNETLKDERTPYITNRNYAIHIPYSVIEPYTLKNVKKYFTKIPFSSNLPVLDPSKKHILIFPELRDDF